MIWFPIIPPHIHHDDYSGGLSCEFRDREKRINKRIEIVGSLFMFIGLVIFHLMLIALFVAYM